MKNHIFKLNQRTLLRLVVVLAGVAFFMVLSHLPFCFSVIGSLLRILNPIFVGLALAYLLDPMARFFERKRMGRTPAVLLTCLISLALFAVVMGFAVPQLVSSLAALVNTFPDYYTQLQSLMIQVENQFGHDVAPVLKLLQGSRDFIDASLQFALENISTVMRYGLLVGHGLYVLFTGAFCGMYIMLEKKRLLRTLRRIIMAIFDAKVAHRIYHVGNTAVTILQAFISGKLLDSLIVGVICLFACAIAGIPYATLIGLVVGVTNVVPIIGPWIGGVFCCMLLFVVNPMSALLLAIIILVLQQIDSHFIAPQILGGTLGLKTFWVLIAILAGGRIGGVTGMVLGVPILGTLFALGSEFMDMRLKAKGLTANGEPLYAEEPLGAVFSSAFAAAREGGSDNDHFGQDETLVDIWGDAEETLQLDLLKELAALGEDIGTDYSD